MVPIHASGQADGWFLIVMQCSFLVWILDGLLQAIAASIWINKTLMLDLCSSE